MLVTTVVLINLLIAMMSDTYQRIQANNRFCLAIKNLVVFHRVTFYDVVQRSLPFAISFPATI